MRTAIVTIFVLISLPCVLRAQEQQPEQAQPQQQPQQHNRPPAADGGVREVLESIVVPPMSGAPFTATLDTEWVKYAADGLPMNATSRATGADESTRNAGFSSPRTARPSRR